jgi:predicted transcriptional regulator
MTREENGVKLAQVRHLLDCTIVAGDGLLEREVGSCFAADLMSDVLAYARPGVLLITGLTTVQSVHTADVADCAGIVFVSGKQPAADALALARERGIPLLSTRRSAFEACGELFRNGLAQDARP